MYEFSYMFSTFVYLLFSLLTTKSTFILHTTFTHLHTHIHSHTATTQSSTWNSASAHSHTNDTTSRSNLGSSTYLSEGCFNTWTGGAWNQSANCLIRGQFAVLPEPHLLHKTIMLTGLRLVGRAEQICKKITGPGTCRIRHVAWLFSFFGKTSAAKTNKSITTKWL